MNPVLGIHARPQANPTRHRGAQGAPGIPPVAIDLGSDNRVLRRRALPRIEDDKGVTVVAWNRPGFFVPRKLVCKRRQQGLGLLIKYQSYTSCSNSAGMSRRYRLGRTSLVPRSVTAAVGADSTRRSIARVRATYMSRRSSSGSAACLTALA